jgi:hypothetical protein
VFGIFTSRAMKERGRYQIQCMKSRSSTGVGMKIDLEYNIDTMRITDPGPEAQQDFISQGGPPRVATNIMNQIKTTTNVASKDVIDAGTGEILNRPPISATIDSSKLKSMLAGLKAKSE